MKILGLMISESYGHKIYNVSLNELLDTKIPRTQQMEPIRVVAKIGVMLLIHTGGLIVTP